MHALLPRSQLHDHDNISYVRSTIIIYLPKDSEINYKIFINLALLKFFYLEVVDS